MTITRNRTQATNLTPAQRRALDGIDVLRSSGGVDMATLRANGHRRDVIDRLCGRGLAFCAGDYGDQDYTRFDLTEKGRDLLAASDEVAS